ncbi:hypothetical protein, partial [Burkholderia sp. Ac-20365]|uniref:hypothetical protein n=1 Tax=Burkholderia sp. Ac-20365 TaxID=2703897 RepID=UPI00197B75CE
MQQRKVGLGVRFHVEVFFVLIFVWRRFVWFACVFAGIRDMSCLLQALPLCGAALTFFAAAKKVSKESGLTPPVLDLRLRAP